MKTLELVIELGSSNTVIYKMGNGIVLREPSLVAIKDGKINFNSTDKTLEIEIGGTTYAISLQQKS